MLLIVFSYGTLPKHHRHQLDSTGVELRSVASSPLQHGQPANDIKTFAFTHKTIWMSPPSNRGGRSCVDESWAKVKNKTLNDGWII